MAEPDTDVLTVAIRAAIAADASATSPPVVGSVLARGRRRGRTRLAAGVVAAVVLTGGAVLAGSTALDRREAPPASGTIVGEPSEVVLDQGVGAGGAWQVVASLDDGACVQYVEATRTGGSCQLTDPARLDETSLFPVLDDGEPFTVVAGPAPRGTAQLTVEGVDGRSVQATFSSLAGRSFFAVRLPAAVGVREVVATDADGAVLASHNRFLPLEALLPPSTAAPPSPPTPEARALVEQFRAFASAPTAERLAGLPLADEVSLGLGDDLLRTVRSDELARPEAWSLPVELYAAGVGPFSALDELQDPQSFQVSVGPHPHCASSPKPGPAQYADAERISVQPGLPECLRWYSVDFFLTDGLVRAITLDYWEP